MKYTHAPISCAIVLVTMVAGGDAFLAWAVMAGWWVSREWTQAEYRWIAQYGDGTRASMPWWGGLDPKAWTFKAFVMDMVLPAVASGALAWLMMLYLL